MRLTIEGSLAQVNDAVAVLAVAMRRPPDDPERQSVARNLRLALAGREVITPSLLDAARHLIAEKGLNQ